MDFIKYILIALGLFTAVILLFWLIGVVYSLIWYLFIAGIIGVVGYAGYKFLAGKDETPQLEEKTPIAIAEMQDFDRALEEYKQKTFEK
ncbi:MAG TPA: hypothetical protein VK892_20280 [Pyrinomonadaceae bacterium]|nr:hypothetical protein [Pyrinomonadaceae bacterium]